MTTVSTASLRQVHSQRLKDKTTHYQLQPIAKAAS